MDLKFVCMYAHSKSNIPRAIKVRNCQLICCELKSGLRTNLKQKMSVYKSSVFG